MVRKLVLALIIAAAPLAASAQAPEQDTICVPVPQLQQMQEEVTELRRKDSVNTEIKRNLRMQVAELETISVQDSIMIRSLENELDFRKQQMELRDKRIQNLESRLRKHELRKWVYFVGGAATVVLGAYVSGQASGG